MDERIEIRVPTDDLKLWRAAAERERMSLAAWIRRQCHFGLDVGVAERAKQTEALNRFAAALTEASTTKPTKPKKGGR